MFKKTATTRLALQPSPLLLILLICSANIESSYAFSVTSQKATPMHLFSTKIQSPGDLDSDINSSSSNNNNSDSGTSTTSTVSTMTSSQTVSSFTQHSQSSTFDDMRVEGENDGVVDDNTDSMVDTVSTVAHSEVTHGVSDMMDLASERQLLEQCLDHQAYTLGPTNIETMQTLHNLATFMYKHSASFTPPSSEEQEKDEAKKLYNICYNQQKHYLGQFHTDTLLTLKNLFTIYYNEGNYEIVKDLILEDVLSPANDASHGGEYYMDWMILDTMLQLAFTYHGSESGSNDVAAELYEAFSNAFYDYTTSNGEDNVLIGIGTHPNHYHYLDFLSVQHNLGALYQERGDYVKARAITERCYESRTAVLGRSHQLTLGTMNNLAALCHKMEDYEDAKSLYCDCYDEKVDCIGEDHPETELTLRNIERLKEVFPF